MKNRLEKMLNTKSEQVKTLRTAMIEAETQEERAAIGETLTALEREIADIRAMLNEIDEPVDTDPAGRNFNPLGTTDMRGGVPNIAGIEERMAFKSFIANGDREQLRAAAGNTTSDSASVIPENLLNQIIEKLESVGTIYNLVSKTAYPVGQTIPVESTRPVATWVGRNTSSLASSNSGEGNGSEPQNGVNFTTSISFTNFKLRCEVAMTEEVATMALSAFEALFVKNVSTAMLRAIEFAIVDGDGYGMPTGILSATPSGTVEVAAADSIEWATLCDAEALIPVEKEAGTKWCMTKKTFMAFVGMTDDNGQPIARINYGIGGKPERFLLGREVVLYAPQAGSNLGNYADTVEADTTFAFLFDFNDYVLNNNYNLGIQHKVDWDNEDHRTKAVGAYDGKVIDTASLVTLTKKKTS